MIYRPEEANTIVNNLNADAQRWMSIYTKLNGIVAEMDTAFISETQKAFHTANESNQQNYVKMKTLLEEMSTALSNAQTTMQETDASEAARIRARFGI